MSPETAVEQPAQRVHLTSAATAILLAASFTLLHAVAVGTHRGQTLDRELFMLSAGADPTVVTLAATARTGILVLGGLVLAAGAVSALRAGRIRAVVRVGAVLVASTLLARALRDHVLPRPDLGVHGFDLNSYPSAHMALVAALAVGIVVLWPRRVSWTVVAVVALLTLAAAGSSVLSRAHRPADVLGALLLVAAVTAATRALGSADAPAPAARNPVPV